MKNDATIRLQVTAQPGSALELAILQTLKEAALNRSRLKKAFILKREKQLKKSERRGL
jgi:hypothetical protein